jgi:hypothetical protein
MILIHIFLGVWLFYVSVCALLGIFLIAGNIFNFVFQERSNDLRNRL